MRAPVVGFADAHRGPEPRRPSSARRHPAALRPAATHAGRRRDRVRYPVRNRGNRREALDHRLGFLKGGQGETAPVRGGAARADRRLGRFSHRAPGHRLSAGRPGAAPTTAAGELADSDLTWEVEASTPLLYKPFGIWGGAADGAQVAARRLSANDKRVPASNAVQVPAWMRPTLISIGTRAADTNVL